MALIPPASPHKKSIEASTASLNSFDSIADLDLRGRSHSYFSLLRAENYGLPSIADLPFSLKVVLENLLRHEDGRTVHADHIRALAQGPSDGTATQEIAFFPARVLMQDLTGVPAVADLAALRAAMAEHGGDPSRVNPRVDIDLVIDHSVNVDHAAADSAYARNVAIEYQRNRERYEFLRWGARAFSNFRVVPPGAGICHQVNLEYLADVVRVVRQRTAKARLRLLYPDSLVGTDSHTTMINGLAVLGWGVGGIEAEAVALGQAISMRIPEVIGFRLIGQLHSGVTATDLVLTITQQLRALNVTGKFVEFFGPGLAQLSLEDRATIANMAPEYGATCGFFPIDNTTIGFLRDTGRSAANVAMVEAYSRAQGLFADPDRTPRFTAIAELDLGEVRPCISGPRRPQDRVDLADAATNTEMMLKTYFNKADDLNNRVPVKGQKHDLGHGDIVIAAITSCTNTSNPSVMSAAGLVARKARQLGLQVKPWVKTSLAPGSQVVTDYLAAAGLLKELNALGFNVVGYGCTTCIGNSGPLAEPIADAIRDGDLAVASVLSGNRNFEGRIHALVRANYLASPPLVVAYALAGSMRCRIDVDPLGHDHDGNPVYLRDIWPNPEEIAKITKSARNPKRFRKAYRNIFKGTPEWNTLAAEGGKTYLWDQASTYVKEPPFLHDMAAVPAEPADIEKAAILALLGDSITTDHISPAGAIKHDSPAGRYLIENGIAVKNFNSYGSRRGNHEVMMRGTFANIRLRNNMADGREGGWTRHYPSGEIVAIYDAAMRYRQQNRPLVVFAGEFYGSGSSRDWAAKGTLLLGVKAVIARSFERIHRTNLIGMGVAPLSLDEKAWESLNLKGDETVSIYGLAGINSPRKTVTLEIVDPSGRQQKVTACCLIQTMDELDYFRHGGILPFVIRDLMAA